jgi:hypothetical protein
MKEKSLISRDNMIKVTACSYKKPKILTLQQKEKNKKRNETKRFLSMMLGER